MNAFRSRFRAAGIHFLISAVVVATVVAGALSFWFPGDLAWAAGLMSLVTILVSVDLILGPALTFLVFKPGKKTLRFDLSVIAILQFSALVFGISSIYQARPVYLAFVVDRFETVSAADLESSMLAQADKRYQQLPTSGPQWVGVKLPTDPDEASALMMAEVLHGTGPELIPRYYTSYESIITHAIDRAKPLSALQQFNPNEAITAQLQSVSQDPAQLRFFPLVGRDRDLTVLVDAQTGAVIEVVDLRPWEP